MITGTSWTMFASFVDVYDGARLWAIIDIRQSKDLSFHLPAYSPRESAFMTAREAVRRGDRPHARCLPVPRTSRVKIFRHNDLKIPINVCERLILQWLRVYLPSTRWNGSMWHRITIRVRNRVMISFKNSDRSILRFARIYAGCDYDEEIASVRGRYFSKQDADYSQIKLNILMRMSLADMK